MATLDYRQFTPGAYLLAADAQGLSNVKGYVDDRANGDSWRLVMAKSAITAPAKKVMVFLVTGGQVVFNVLPSSAANSLVVAGVADENLTATSLAAGDYFWCKRRGVTVVKAASTLSAVGEPAATITTTAGSVGEFVIPAATSATKNQDAIIGYCTAVFVTTTSNASIRLTNVY